MPDGPLEVSGEVKVNTIWRKAANSPYIVTGNLMVASGVTLTIEPGVTVKFDSGKVLIVDGDLVARGTSSDRIIFTSSAAYPEPGDWGYIKLSDSTTDASFDGNGDYLAGSVVEYATISYGDGV